MALFCGFLFFGGSQEVEAREVCLKFTNFVLGSGANRKDIPVVRYRVRLAHSNYRDTGWINGNTLWVNLDPGGSGRSYGGSAEIRLANGLMYTVPINVWISPSGSNVIYIDSNRGAR